MSGKYTLGPYVWAPEEKDEKEDDVLCQSLLKQLESICTIANENGGNVPYAEIKAAMELVAKAKGELK